MLPQCGVGKRSEFVQSFGRAAPSEMVGGESPAGNFMRERQKMKNIVQNVKKFLKSEDGPTAVEYAVMLALIVIVCLTAIQAIGTNATAKFQKVADTLNAT